MWMLLMALEAVDGGEPQDLRNGDCERGWIGGGRVEAAGAVKVLLRRLAGAIRGG